MTATDPVASRALTDALDAWRPSAVAPAGRLRESTTPSRRAIHRYLGVVAIVDTAVVLAACALAIIARFGFSAGPVEVDGTGIDYWIVAGGIAALWLAALALYRTRDPKIIAAGSFEYRRTVSATAMAFGLAAIAMFALQIEFTRSFFLIALPLGVVGLTASRWVLRSWLARQRRRGRLSLSAIVVGPREDVRRVLAQVGPSTASAYRVVAAVVDDDEPSGDPMTVPLTGSIDDVATVVRNVSADAVIVAGQPRGGGDFIRNLSWSLERTNADLMIASRLANVAGPRIHFRPADGLPLMHVELPNYEGGKHALKRALDVVLAGSALVMLLPVIVVIGALIKRDSRGPVFFTQERVGRNGRSFRMLKFRSMVETAERDLAALLNDSDGNGVLFKMREDPRVTRVGRALRKYSLDELPQLWNVVVGDMSLVGPRPPLVREVEAYEDHVFRRLYIKPGLTGMWQVSGRSDLSWEESVRLDLYYVENWSLAGDLQIMWRTVKVVLKPNGAY